MKRTPSRTRGRESSPSTKPGAIQMVKHLDVTTDGTRIYFCDAPSPWQPGRIDTNGLLLHYSPKATDLSVHSARDLVRVAKLNKRPRSSWATEQPTTFSMAVHASRD